MSVNLAKRAAELATEHWDTQGPDAAGYAALVSLLVRAQSDGAREERARIVAWLRGRLPALPYYQWDAKAFDIELTADAIERGEHEEKANGT